MVAETSSVVTVENGDAPGPWVIICEHASNHIPAELNELGIDPAHRESHAAWDPGALPVARILSERLNGKLIASGISRLVYDCNRPPDAPDAMPAKSEIVDVPGNVGLTDSERARRVADYYVPFRRAVADAIERTEAPIIVTMHSFTPVYHGKPRAVEFGVLHDVDTRLADAMLEMTDQVRAWDVQRNEPYGMGDGVTHTVQVHAIAHGHLNVMLEVRNDLIASPEDHKKIGEAIASWLLEAAGSLNL